VCVAEREGKGQDLSLEWRVQSSESISIEEQCSNIDFMFSSHGGMDGC
jgi:hypothetical protein